MRCLQDAEGAAVQSKRRRPPKTDSRAKLTPEERQRKKPPPVEQEAFEDVIRRLVRPSSPTKHRP